MELVKNIFFNTDKLIENSSVKISYTGKFLEDNSEKVFLHFGFGETWENISDIEMTKNDLGFQAEISIPESDSLNFCFKNEKDQWDNNNGQDYSFAIEKQQVALVPVEEVALANNKLRKSYLWSKKVKIAIYKIMHYIPKLISGNYKRNVNQINN